MVWLLLPLAVASGTAFVFYGHETLFKERLRGEFERYGMPGVRTFVGSMHLLGGAGVLIGLLFAPVGVAAATGLTVMMALGLILRLKIRDAPRLMIPVVFLGFINSLLIGLFLLQ